MPSVAYENIANQCHSISLGLLEANDAKVTVSCQCELIVALHAVSSLPYSGIIELGVSKFVCWLCQKFLESLSLHSANRILISEYQGKCHKGCRLSLGIPGPVEEGMRQLVEGEIDEIREAIDRRQITHCFPSHRNFFLISTCLRNLHASL